MVFRTARPGHGLLRRSRREVSTRSSKDESAESMKSQSFRSRGDRLTEPATKGRPPAAGKKAGTISHQRRAGSGFTFGPIFSWSPARPAFFEELVALVQGDVGRRGDCRRARHGQGLKDEQPVDHTRDRVEGRLQRRHLHLERELAGHEGRRRDDDRGDDQRDADG